MPRNRYATNLPARPQRNTRSKSEDHRTQERFSFPSHVNGVYRSFLRSEGSSRLFVRQPPTWKQVHLPLNMKETWICTVFFSFFFPSSVSLRSGLLHPVCLHSTNQHLTEECIYKPSASGAINDWYPECFGPSQLYVLKAIGRSQDSCPSQTKGGEFALG